MILEYIPAELFVLTEIQAYYLYAILLTFVFSGLLPFIKDQLFYVPASLIILFVAHSYIEVLYFLMMCSITILSTKMLQDRSYAKYVNMWINMLGFLIYLYCFPIVYYSVSGSLMMLVIKSYYLGKEYNEKSNICQLLGYMFFPPGLMLGPVISFSKYCNDKKEYDFKENLKLVVGSFVYFGIHLAFIDVCDYNYVVQTDNLILRMIMLMLFCLHTRLKFYFVWTFTEGCYGLMGFPGITNIKPKIVERADSIKVLQKGWNIFTNEWLKDSVFTPISNHSYFWASMATFAVSALWHGFNPCYFVMFLTFSIYYPMHINNEALMKRYLGFGEKTIININRVIMTLFLSFYAVPFIVLDLETVNAIWSSVYYYGVVFIGLSAVLFIFARQKKIKIIK